MLTSLSAMTGSLWYLLAYSRSIPFSAAANHNKQVLWLNTLVGPTFNMGNSKISTHVTKPNKLNLFPIQIIKLLACRAPMAALWKRRSVLKSWAISRTRRWKGSFLIRSSVDFWYLRISLRATVPGLHNTFKISICRPVNICPEVQHCRKSRRSR